MDRWTEWVSLLIALMILAGCTEELSDRQGGMPAQGTLSLPRPRPIVLASSESLPAVPDADLTVEMLPEGPAVLLSFTNSFWGDMIEGSDIVRALFETNTGIGYLATYQAPKSKHCFGFSIGDFAGGQCGFEGDRFSVIAGGFDGGRERVNGPNILVEYVGILGPTDVEAFEIEFEDGFVVAIASWNGAGYANWMGNEQLGQLISITAHFADGTSEEADY